LIRYLKTPLHYACERGYPDSVLLLIENECDIDARDTNGSIFRMEWRQFIMVAGMAFMMLLIF